MAKAPRIGEIVEPERMSGRQLARVFEVTPQAVYAWPGRGCPQNRDKTFDLTRVIAWFVSKAEEAAEKPEQRSGVRSKELERLTRAKANIEELKLDRLRGELVSVSIVRSEIGTAVEMFRQGVLGLPSQLSGRLEGLNASEIQHELERVLVERVTELRDGFEQAARSEMVEDDEVSVA